jgi:hypothetical protein
MRWWGRFLFLGDRFRLLFFDKPAPTALVFVDHHWITESLVVDIRHRTSDLNQILATTAISFVFILEFINNEFLCSLRRRDFHKFLPGKLISFINVIVIVCIVK